MDRIRAREGLIEFLASVVKAGSSVDEADDDTNLIQASVIDSFAIIQIISYLEQEYDLNLIASGVDPTELATIGGMLAAIRAADE